MFAPTEVAAFDELGTHRLAVQQRPVLNGRMHLICELHGSLVHEQPSKVGSHSRISRGLKKFAPSNLPSPIPNPPTGSAPAPQAGGNTPGQRGCGLVPE